MHLSACVGEIPDRLDPGFSCATRRLCAPRPNTVHPLWVPAFRCAWFSVDSRLRAGSWWLGHSGRFSNSGEASPLELAKGRGRRFSGLPARGRLLRRADDAGYARRLRLGAAHGRRPGADRGALLHHARPRPDPPPGERAQPARGAGLPRGHGERVRARRRRAHRGAAAPRALPPPAAQPARAGAAGDRRLDGGCCRWPLCPP